MKNFSTKNLLTLDMFEVLTFTLNKNEDELRQPINDTFTGMNTLITSSMVRPLENMFHHNIFIMQIKLN